MKIGATSWLMVRGVALTATGFLAGIGMTFVCFVRYKIFVSTQAHPFNFGDRIMPGVVYVTFFALMAAWVVIASVFAWRNRTRLGLILSAIAFIVFALSANNVLRFAYPVCNAL